MANDYVLRPVLDKTFMEYELERAFKRVESEQTIGKVVIQFWYLCALYLIQIIVTIN